jgi:LmbE family N-acetylglucosaminyl deacetylase
MNNTKYYCECGFYCRKIYYFQSHKKICNYNKNNEKQKLILQNTKVKPNLLDSILKKYDENKKYNTEIIEMLRNWWNKYSDRKFMIELYPKIGEYLSNIHILSPCVLDIGVENYNIINKDLLNNNNINYFQCEPFINGKQFNNNKTLECFIENLSTQYNDYENYFDVIIDFGVLGAFSISKDWSQEKIKKYIENILFVLKDNGLYFLKIDMPYMESDNFIIDFEKYFDLIPFINYPSILDIFRKLDGRRKDFTNRDRYKFFFLKKKKQINNLIVVAHPDDETIFCDEKLTESTYVIVVFGKNKFNFQISLDREKEFRNVMKITKCSYELWNYIDKKTRDDKNIVNSIKNNIKRVLNNYLHLQTIYFHNKFGETGHIDHIRIHNIMKEVLIDFYYNKDKSIIPDIYEFNPQLNYESYIKETDKRKLLLDKYKTQTIDLFRNIKLDFTKLNLFNIKQFLCKDCNIDFDCQNKYNRHKKHHKQQEKYFDEFIKYSLDNIEVINSVPKVAFLCWFGGYGKKLPLMSDKRFNAFTNLVKNIGIPVILLTYKNMYSFEKPEFKINKSFEFLSGVHKSDYLRVYMLHHYGGSYHDIKHRKDSWKYELEKDNWTLDENIWIYGRQEKNENAIGYPPGMKHIQKEYAKLVSMGYVICRKQTKYTEELLNNIEQILNKKYDELKKYPGYNSNGYYSTTPFDLTENNSYPLRWLEILGELSHPLMLKYCEHIKFGLSDAIKSRYK